MTTKAQSIAKKREFIRKAWAKRGVHSMPGIDKDEYPSIRGMEGPFQMKNGRKWQVLYYDPREGKYYDRKTDMYVDEARREGVVEDFTRLASIRPLRPGLQDMENTPPVAAKFEELVSRFDKSTDYLEAKKIMTQLKRLETKLINAGVENYRSVMNKVTTRQSRLRQMGEHENILSDRMKTLAGMQAPQHRGLMDNLDMGQEADPESSVWPNRREGTSYPGTALALKNERKAAAAAARAGKKNTTGKSRQRYELVSNGRLKVTLAKPADAKAMAMKMKGKDVQVVDSKTGKILYDRLSKKARNEMKIDPEQVTGSGTRAIDRLKSAQVREDVSKANAFLKMALNAAKRLVLDKTKRANITMFAQRFAARAYKKGERFHAGNATTYPAKHYPKLEKSLGILNAKELAFFDRAYDAYMSWEGATDTKSAQVQEGIFQEVSTRDKKATVRIFLLVLSSKITQADAAQAKRDAKRGIPPNIYSLGLMLEAVNKVEADVRSVLDNDDAESLGKLKKSIGRRFNMVSPVKFTLKAIDKYLATGKLPSIAGKGGASPVWGRN